MNISASTREMGNPRTCSVKGEKRRAGERKALLVGGGERDRVFGYHIQHGRVKGLNLVSIRPSLKAKGSQYENAPLKHSPYLYGRETHIEPIKGLTERDIQCHHVTQVVNIELLEDICLSKSR